MAKKSRSKVFLVGLTEGWGIIRVGNRRAHYYRNGYPICRYVVRFPGPYVGKLRVTRNSRTNCQRCEVVLAAERDESCLQRG